MLKSFLKYINQENLVESNEKTLLGISGGIDSMVMLDLFNKAGFRFSIAHCNFNLRGNESDGDQKFVEDYTNQNNIELFTKRFSTKEYAAEYKISIQMAARELRINWFHELLGQKNFKYYATAHHLDDQAETFFINLLRGTGIAGLHGILPKQEKLIHPLMFTNRKAIIQYANDANINFREDSSNKETKYLRNKIRHQILPSLNKIKPDFAKTLSKSIKQIGAAERIYKKEIARVTNIALKKNKDNTHSIGISELENLPDAEVYLFEMISDFNFNYSDAEDMIKSIISEPGKIFYSITHRIIRDRNCFIIEEKSKAKDERKEYCIDKFYEKITEPLNLLFETINVSNKFKINPDKKIGFFDVKTLKFPLKIRRWQKGDFFYPLGLNHKKLLSDFFTDIKFNLRDKENVWLLTSGDDIVWIIGHRIDNRFKLTNQTTQAIKVSFLSE